MFTGLIETTGTLDQISPRGPGIELVIRTSSSLVSELVLGESVAVDGACLTVTKMVGDRFWVDASGETMRSTTLGKRNVGDLVHLERALRVGDRLGGHWVTGHIDHVGTLRSRAPLGDALQLWFNVPPELQKYLVKKGSIAIDGASLTINEIDVQGFSIVLIPHTRSVLQLEKKRPGASVNLEADVLGKYVERLLHGALGQSALHEGAGTSYPSSSLDLSTLAKAGFIK